MIEKGMDIKNISKQLELLRSKGYTKEVLESILNAIILQNKYFPIDIAINDSKIPSFFSVDEKKIEIPFEYTKLYVYKKIRFFLLEHPSLEKDMFYNMIMAVLLHERAHYHQYLIGEKYTDFPYEIVSEAYKNLFSYELGNVNVITATIKTNRFDRYYCKTEFLLERNANVETFDLLHQVALYENNKELIEILEHEKNYYLALGYNGLLYNGAMKKTYSKILGKALYNSFNHTEEISLCDRVRYGLPIDNETRKRVLKHKFNI